MRIGSVYKVISDLSETTGNITEARVTNLVSDLADKTAIGHTHPITDLSGLTGSPGSTTFLRGDGSWATALQSAVTSVGLSLPSIFTVSNSPVTSVGSLTAVFASQSAGLFLASPSGTAGAMSARAIVTADIPSTLNATLFNGVLSTVTTATFGGQITGTSAQFTGVVQATNGTANTPAFCFSSASNMGIYRATSTSMGFAVAGAQQMTLDNGGAVGATSATFSGQMSAGSLTSAASGIPSAPNLSLVGNWYSGGSSTTTKPKVLIEPSGTASTSWSTAGTGFGVNAPSGFAGNLLDLQTNAVGKFSVNNNGFITSVLVSPAVNSTPINIGWTGGYFVKALVGGNTYENGLSIAGGMLQVNNTNNNEHIRLQCTGSTNGIGLDTNQAFGVPKHRIFWGNTHDGSYTTALACPGAGIVTLTDADATNDPAFGIQAKSSTTAAQDRYRIVSSAVDNTHASRKYRIVHNAYDTAARECMRMEANGSAAMIGFLGANAIIRPTVTGSRADGTALASLLTAMANLGLITDSSTA